ncbi:MarR family winged helix-turn-helix transcriptional regulator [Paenibacillus sp. R14(2021)]|uniref:MarR family winged helix-turn-helix transcriptional regulator n=1 Tax=Paenibacillus sp. R14(2021) TaxID=2859228 RepID=UPI001C6155CF|nr:winged helix DNA-binding protein [Paenibacillus sp. R14(2021)]
MNEFMKTIHLTASQAEVIRVLEQRQPLSLKELGGLLVCESGSPSRLIDRMAEEALLEKVVNPSDARYLLLQLTEKGIEKAEHIKDFESKMYQDLEQLITPSELAMVTDTLEKLISQFSIIDTLRRRNFLRNS